MSVMFLKHWVSTSVTPEISVENVPAVVHIKTPKGRFYCTQVLYWVGGGDGEECGKEEECC